MYMIIADWLAQSLFGSLIFFLIIWRVISKAHKKIFSAGILWYVAGVLATTFISTALRCTLLISLNSASVLDPNENLSIIIFLVLPACSAILISFILLKLPEKQFEQSAAATHNQANEWQPFVIISAALILITFLIFFMTNRIAEGRQSNIKHNASTNQQYGGGENAHKTINQNISSPSTSTIQENQQHQVVPAPAEQSSPEERFALAVKDLERRYSIYNTGSQLYSQEAVDATLNKMNEFVAAGYDPASALLMAGDSVAPFYMQRLYDAAARTQLSERAGQVNTPPYQSKQRKAVVGSGSVPAYEPDKCQFKPVMTDEDLRNCGILKK